MSQPEPETIPARLRADHVSVSFEFFPPKDDAGEDVLWEAIRRLERVSPDFVSVTYGAGGTTQDRTVRITEEISRRTSLTAMAHLTCVGKSVRELEDVLDEFADAGIDHVLALRGDPPGDVRATWTAHPEGLTYASELVELIARRGGFEIGVAAFPDVHPESADLDADVETLVRKAEAGASFAVTQMVFDPETYLALRDRVNARVDLPITAGIMPITNLKQIRRMSELMGTPIPAATVERLHAVEGDPAAVRAEGIAIAIEMCQRLLDEGVPGLHFITMNRSTATLEVHGALGLGDR
ncbi:methylenetetrahydrofolate reductase [NAD(P)H] [Janibacter massiliensis]|uniref:methylenetetrahydrofolate reductase [NAD(P)H] n=1 Tax=Janibacter massiliensis TaxID=2058291 RepID=UPI000D109AD6|nr:methylenetetrahydrofolate reductase [NAD(P)H] [Janibacter massiliensis]